MPDDLLHHPYDCHHNIFNVFAGLQFYWSFTLSKLAYKMHFKFLFDTADKFLI